MFHDLSTCARNVTVRLGATAPELPSGDDAAAYLQFFAALVAGLEVAAADVDNLVDEECRELLSIAVTRILCNLYLADSKFDFSSVIRPVVVKNPAALEREVREHVDALVEVYARVDEDGEDGQGEKQPQDDGNASSA